MNHPVHLIIVSAFLVLTTGVYAGDRPKNRSTDATKSTAKSDSSRRKRHEGESSQPGTKSFGDKTGNSFGDKTGNGVGDKTGNGVGDKTGNGVGDKTGNGVGDKTGNSFGDKTGNSFGDKTGNSFGDKTGNSFGDKTGNGIDRENTEGVRGDKTGNGMDGDDSRSRDQEFGDKTGNGGYVMEYLETHELEPHDETFAREILHREARLWNPSLTREDILNAVLKEVRTLDKELYWELMKSKTEYDRISISLEAFEQEIGPEAYDMLGIPQSYDVGIDLSSKDRRPRQVINWFNPGEFTLQLSSTDKPHIFDLVLHDDKSVDTMKPYRQAWMDFHEISFETHRRMHRVSGYKRPNSSLKVQKWTAQFFSQGPVDWTLREDLFPSSRRR